MLKPDQMQAAKSLLRMIESNPLDVSAYCKLASLYESSGEHQKANLTLRRALEIDPFHQEAWLRLGIHHMNRGEWRSAADAFERSTVISPMDASSWIGNGMASIAAQDLRAACRMRDTLVAKFADRPETHVIAGHIGKIQGHFAAAADSYRRALTLDPAQAEACTIWSTWIPRRRRIRSPNDSNRCCANRRFQTGNPPWGALRWRVSTRRPAVWTRPLPCTAAPMRLRRR